MTPLAMKIARELTLPVKRRSFHNEDILSLFGGDMHCFDVSAIAKPIGDAMDESNVWPDVAGLLDNLFLPSPVTWLEYFRDGNRVAHVITKEGPWWRIYMAIDGNRVVGGETAKFRPCSILTSPEMIEVVALMGQENPLEVLLGDKPSTKPETASPEALQPAFSASTRAEFAAFGKDQMHRAIGHKNLLEFEIDAKQQAIDEANGQLEILRAAKSGIAFSVLAIDLINTPGLVGFRQHAPHATFAKQFARLNVGKYPLRSWSEVTVKTHTTVCNGQYESGVTFRKCLHFVRAHQRHYRTGRVSLIPAHWRGDPALGIKRTRYRVTA